MTIKIDLPETHTVTKGPRDKSWLAEVTCNVTALSADIVARLAMHGLHQKIADAASGAETLDEASAAMQKALDGLLAGEWTQRTGGGGVDERTAVTRSVVRGAVKAKFGAKSAEWASFTGLDDAAQNAKLDEWAAANADAFAPAIEAELAERAAKRARKADLVKGVAFTL